MDGIDIMKLKLKDLRDKKMKVIEDRDYEKATLLRDSELELLKKIDELELLNYQRNKNDKSEYL